MERKWPEGTIEKDVIDDARKEVSGQPKSAHTEENIELVEEIILRKED